MPALPDKLPVPRTFDPQSAPPLRWGILAPGGIARAFAYAANTHTAQQIVAVGSRDLDRAQAFAGKWGVERAYGSYQELVDDPQVQAVYVASPHSEHRDHALLAIAAGKHVLVEKSFAQTAAQAQQMFDAAAEAGVVAMEAMWSRFLPHYDVIRQLVEGGALGDLVTVVADHGQALNDDPNGRLLNPDLAGGALLDLGIYPISFASFVLGTPTRIQAAGTKASTGVDGQASAVFEYAGGAQALVSTTLFGKTPTTASISGTQARIEIPGDFYMPQPVHLIDRDGNRRTWDDNPLPRHEGFAFEIAELARVVTGGRQQSELMTPPETVSIIATIDEIRAQIGIALPGD